MKRITLVLVLSSALIPVAQTVSANEYTDVIDSFDWDNNDPFDINLTLQYERQGKSGKIVRETYAKSTPAHDWDYYAYRYMFDYKEVTHLLHINLEIGIWEDLSFKFRMPLILKNTRSLNNGGDAIWDPVRIGEDGDVATKLFDLPFKSPDRSGLDYLAFGLWWGILDQGRDDTKPNWTIFVEGRFGVGEEMRAACNDAQNLVYDGSPPPQSARTCGKEKYDLSPGVSRGLNEIAMGSRLSRRYGRVDPYAGLEALLGWPKDGTAFKLDNNAAGAINENPPMVGTLEFGLEVIPWEQPEQFRKVSVIIGAGGRYHSEGREYTPLFDALGTSPLIRRDKTKWVDFNGNGLDDDDPVDPAAYTGMTDVENYASFFGKLYVMVMPAKYVKFRIGLGLTHETEHFITKTDQCPAGKIAADGLCSAYNQGHRPEIDSPGSRFRAEETFIGDFFIDSTAMF